MSQDLPDGVFAVVGSVTLNLSGDDGSATCYLRLNGIVLDQQTFDFSSGVEHDAATLMTDADGDMTADIACSVTKEDPDVFDDGRRQSSVARNPGQPALAELPDARGACPSGASPSTSSAR